VAVAVAQRQFGNAVEGKTPPLEAASKQRLLKTEEFMCAVVSVMFEVCNSAVLMYLIVVTFC
jgi:hypothetical protein